jgi:hypothetical protein
MSSFAGAGSFGRAGARGFSPADAALQLSLTGTRATLKFSFGLYAPSRAVVSLFVWIMIARNDKV